MSLCGRINELNALGRQNLRNKGVAVADTATAFEIMNLVADIVVGGGSGVDRLYEHYGVDKTVYPYVLLMTKTSGYARVYFTEYITSNKIGGATKKLLFSQEVSVDLTTFPEATDTDKVITFFIENVPTSLTETKSDVTWNTATTLWINTQEFVGNQYIGGLYYLV